MRVYERLPWHVVAKRDGRSQQTLERVVKDYLDHVDNGELVESPLDADAIELVRTSLERLAEIRDTAAELVTRAENQNAVIGALRTQLRAEKQYVELLQGVGKLPRELGTLRHLVEIRAVAQRLNELLGEFEAGKITATQVRLELDQFTGVPQLDEDDAGEDDGEVTDAEVVAA